MTNAIAILAAGTIELQVEATGVVLAIGALGIGAILFWAKRYVAQVDKQAAVGAQAFALASKNAAAMRALQDGLDGHRQRTDEAAKKIEELRIRQAVLEERFVRLERDRS